MTTRLLTIGVLATAIAAVLLSVGVVGQGVKNPSAKVGRYVPSRTAWGDPNLQGNYTTVDRSFSIGGGGGAIHSTSTGSLTISQSILARNSATGDLARGGAIYNVELCGGFANHDRNTIGSVTLC